MFAYPQSKQKKILDIVLDIMDEGPKPMKNFKAAEKNRNSVDQFWDAHQAEYEARGRSEDQVNKVNQHNMTYPSLRNELDKRRSILKLTNIKRNNSKQFYCAHCEACVERLYNIKKLYIKRKQKPKNRRTNIYQEIKSPVRKTKYKSKRKRNKMADTLNRITSCYIPMNHKLVGVDSSVDIKNDLNKNEIHLKLNERKSFVNERMICDLERTNDNENEQSIKSFNPDTSVASMSSYKSYFSMEHEPMV